MSLLYFKVSTNKPPLSYTVGEEIIFTVQARNNTEVAECRRFSWAIKQDDGVTLSGEGAYMPGRDYTISTRLTRPGYSRITVTALNDDGTPDPRFDINESGAGADVEKIAFCGNEPEDFDAYWQGIKDIIADFTPQLVSKVPYHVNVPDWCDCYDIKLTTPIDSFASGYISIPKGEGPFPLEVSFRGYAIVGAQPMFNKNRICVNFNALGIENGFEREALEQKYPELRGYGFNTVENEDPYKTFWRSMAIRNFAGIKWAKALPMWDKKNLFSVGGSQGAFQATIFAAQDSDVNFLNIQVPWFCNLNAENNGYIKGWRPQPQKGLEYFDTVLHGARVKCPVKILAYLGDDICPPATITALYNSIKSKKFIQFVQNGTHGYRPPEVESQFLEYDPEVCGVEKARYRHYKGNIYEVICIARDTDSPFENVIYTDGKNIWSRQKQFWNETVIYNGTPVRRFEKL